jgi:hypothetical protein
MLRTTLLRAEHKSTQFSGRAAILQRVKITGPFRGAHGRVGLKTCLDVLKDRAQRRPVV